MTWPTFEIDTPLFTGRIRSREEWDALIEQAREMKHYSWVMKVPLLDTGRGIPLFTHRFGNLDQITLGEWLKQQGVEL